MFCLQNNLELIMSKNCWRRFQFLRFSLFTKNLNSMSDLIKYALGIDVSKDKMDALLMTIDLKQNSKIKAQHKFANTMVGFKELNQWCGKHAKDQVPVEVLIE